MNPWKEAWLQETMAEYDVVTGNISPDPNPMENISSRMIEYEYQQRKTALGVAVMLSGLKHASQSQIKGRLGMALRVGGRVGIRAVPVIGAVYTAYSVYSWFKD